jgi:hypothetical protein
MEIQSLKSGDHIEIRAFDANLDDRRKPPSGAIIVQGAVSSYDDEPGAVTYHLRGPDGEVISRVPTPHVIVWVDPVQAPLIVAQNPYRKLFNW